MAGKTSYPKVRLKTWNTEIQGLRAMYEAAGRNERAERSWIHARGESSRYLLGKTLPVIRRRCRYEARNNPIAAAIVDYIDLTTIATGIRPRIQDKALLRLWNEFVEQADADGDLDLYQLLSLIIREVIIGGEAFVRLRPRRPEDGLKIPLQVQVLPSEFVPLEDDLEGKLVSGIRFDEIGRRKKYLMHAVHPGDGGVRLASVSDYNEVDASRVLHVFRKLEAGQVRGEPWLVRSIIRLHELDEYEDSELVKKNFTARLSLLLEKSAEAQTAGMIGDDEDDEAEETAFIPSLKPGDNFVAPPGYKITVPQAHQSGAEFPIYVRQILREACAGLAPVDLVLDDMQSPERAIQLSLAKYQKVLEKRRKMLIRSVLKPIWAEFLKIVELKGLWRPEAGKTLVDYLHVQWVGEPLPNIRPLQQAQADTERMRNGTLTHAAAVEQYGEDYADLIEQLAKEAADRDERGLVLDGDPRRTAGSGAVQKAEQAAAEQVSDDPEAEDAAA